MRTHFPLSLAAALALVACSRTGIPQQPVALEASYESMQAVSVEEILPSDGDFSATRSNISDKGVFVWNDWDEIGIWSDAFHLTSFALTDGAGAAKARFSGAFLEGEQQGDLAVYPFDAHSWDGATLRVHYPDSYTYASDTTDTRAVMIATSLAEHKLDFKHVGGVIRIRYKNVPTSATHVRFTFPKQRVTGDFPVDLSEEEPVARMEEGSSSLTIYFSSPTEPKNTRHFYLPVPTGTISSLKIEFFDENDQFIKGTRYQSSSSLTVDRRQFLRMPGLVLTVISAGIE